MLLTALDKQLHLKQLREDVWIEMGREEKESWVLSNNIERKRSSRYFYSLKKLAKGYLPVVQFKK